MSETETVEQCSYDTVQASQGNEVSAGSMEQNRGGEEVKEPRGQGTRRVI